MTWMSKPVRLMLPNADRIHDSKREKQPFTWLSPKRPIQDERGRERKRERGDKGRKVVFQVSKDLKPAYQHVS